MHAFIVFLPLIGAVVAGLLSVYHKDRLAEIFTITALLASLLLSILVFLEIVTYQTPVIVDIGRWIVSGEFTAQWSLRFDALTAVMLIVVTGVSSMVHIYSLGYMSHDNSRARFMSYLSLFTFAMLMLVTADNLVQLFFGWEGVGVASYLLIGFWYKKEAAHKAAMKAFIVNRVGDFGFALGILAVYGLFGSVQFDIIFAQSSLIATYNIQFLGLSLPALEVAALLLFIGAMGKSAQLGLHTWLPDAMEGPTPVSALIHAATMVTAGVFMVCRLSPMIEYAPFALDVITIVGSLTAIFAATVGLTQFDIKRVIAYSTCSQLGYMFFAAGVSAYPAAMFHLTTHAFFKALLFLGAGSVIHAFSGEQDLRNMGGIWRKVPVTYSMMWVGSLALAGFPFFSGYYSKDMILEAAYAAQSGVGNLAFWLGSAAAFLTAFYTWRLLFLAFHGKPRASTTVIKSVHESPLVMTLPLLVLAAGAIFSGWLGYELFVGKQWPLFWGDSIFILQTNAVMENARLVPNWVKLMPVFLATFGVSIAVLFYLLVPDLPGRFATIFRPVYAFFYNKWYFDELYEKTFVKPAVKLGNFFWVRGDRETIDGFGPDGISTMIYRISGVCSRVQTGFVFHYAFAMLIGVVLLISWYILRFKV